MTLETVGVVRGGSQPRRTVGAHFRMGPCTVRKAQQSERHNSPKGTTVRANSPKGTTVSSDCPRSVEAQFEHCSQAAQYCCNNDVPAIDKLLHPAIRGVLYSDVETLASASHTPGGRRCQRLHVLWVLVAMPAESVWSRSKADITVTAGTIYHYKPQRVITSHAVFQLS